MPSLNSVRGPIDVGQRIKSDHAFDRETPGDDVVHQQRYELFRHAVALDHAADGSAVLQERRLERYFGAFARAAEEHASAGGNQTIDRFTEHGGKRGCLKCKACAEPGYFSDFRNDVFAFGVIDRVCRAKFPRQSQSMLVDIDRDDRIAANDLCGHQT